MPTIDDSSYRAVAMTGSPVRIVGPPGAALFQIYVASGTDTYIQIAEAPGTMADEGGPVPAGSWVAEPCAVQALDAPGMLGTDRPIIWVQSGASEIRCRFTRGGLR